jgi:hypothetical protein
MERSKKWNLAKLLGDCFWVVGKKRTDSTPFGTDSGVSLENRNCSEVWPLFGLRKFQIDE